MEDALLYFNEFVSADQQISALINQLSWTLSCLEVRK